MFQGFFLSACTLLNTIAHLVSAERSHGSDFMNCCQKNMITPSSVVKMKTKRTEMKVKDGR